MSKSEIRTTLLHLRDSDDHDVPKLIKYADFRIHHRNLVDVTGLVRFDMQNAMDYILQCISLADASFLLL